MATLTVSDLSARTAERHTRDRSVRTQRQSVESLSRRGQEHGERSVAGAIYPGLHAELRAIRAAAGERGSDGLSAIDVVEGSAFIYGRERVRPSADVMGDLRVAAVDPDGPYWRLIDAASRVLGEWNSEAVLAASALALRYERPGGAFLLT
jgi:hypothetical protein